MPLSSESIRRVLYVLTAVAVAVIIVLLYTGIRNFGRPSYTISTSGNTIVKELQKLNRLETTEFHVEKVIEAGTNGNVFQEFLYGDRILLVAVGSVIAGIDMSKLRESDLTVNAPGVISAHFPAPEIFTTALDNSQTRVFDRKLGVFTKGDKDLEARARGVAENIMREGACKENVLGVARTNAINQLEALLKALGFSQVTVTVAEGSC